MNSTTGTIVKQAVLVVVVVDILLCGVEGKTLVKGMSLKKKQLKDVLYIKPVQKQKLEEFFSFTKSLLSYEGPMECTFSLNELGRRRRMCSNATLILLRAYCQWLLDDGIHPLDDFCYEPPLDFS